VQVTDTSADMRLISGQRCYTEQIFTYTP